jgi:hypothetical protein
MTQHHDALPDEVLFAPDGHLTETALTCVADGEVHLLRVGALDHLDGCDLCTHRLGEAALLSIVAGEALGDRAALVVAAPATLAHAPEAHLTQASAPLRGRVRRPLPVAAIAAALLIAVVTAGPALLSAIQGVPGVLAAAVEAAPFLFRLARAFVRAPWGAGSLPLLVNVGSAVVLAAVGLQVARITSRSGSWQQGGV